MSSSTLGEMLGDMTEGEVRVAVEMEGMAVESVDESTDVTMVESTAGGNVEVVIGALLTLLCVPRSSSTSRPL